MNTLLSQWQACSVLVIETTNLTLSIIPCNILDNNQFSDITDIVTAKATGGLSVFFNLLLITIEENKNYMFDYRIYTL